MSFETLASRIKKKDMFKYLLGCLYMCKELSDVIGTNICYLHLTFGKLIML